MKVMEGKQTKFMIFEGDAVFERAIPAEILRLEKWQFLEWNILENEGQRAVFFKIFDSERQEFFNIEICKLGKPIDYCTCGINFMPF